MVNQRVSSEDLNDTSRFRPVEFSTVVHKKLMTSLCVPSFVHAYSLCISYMESWFMGKFPENYFKTVYVEGKHALAEFIRHDNQSNGLIKRPKPALSITPTPDYSFTNNELNWNLNNSNSHARMTHGRDIFFKDQDKHIIIGVNPEVLMINFNFKIKVNTRAKQVDIYRFILNNIGTTCTEGNYVDFDFHVPYDMMIQLANDIGFEIKDNKILNILDFLDYVNSRSVFPIVYKVRLINGKNEFFIRARNYVHIRYPNEIRLDDGERQGQISSNYILDYEVQVRFPCPRYYRYLSQYEHKKITTLDDEGNIKAYYVDFSSIPISNSKGWQTFSEADLASTKEELHTQIKIEFKELLEDTDLLSIIEFTKMQHLAPELFVDIKAYNNNSELLIDIDWDNYIINTIEPISTEITRIVVYVDRKYLNEQISLRDDYYTTQIGSSENTNLNLND